MVRNLSALGAALEINSPLWFADRFTLGHRKRRLAAGLPHRLAQGEAHRVAFERLTPA
jgi:hypothetical protein